MLIPQRRAKAGRAARRRDRIERPCCADHGVDRVPDAGRRVPSRGAARPPRETTMLHNRNVNGEIEHLDQLSRAELRELWKRELAEQPPSSLGRRRFWRSALPMRDRNGTTVASPGRSPRNSTGCSPVRSALRITPHGLANARPRSRTEPQDASHLVPQRPARWRNGPASSKPLARLGAMGGALARGRALRPGGRPSN